MSKPSFVTRSIAVTAVAGLSTLAFSPAAFATHDGTGHADSSASTGTGAIFELLDTDICEATDTAETESGVPTGRCGEGIDLNNQVGVFDQTAEAPGDGTSAAFASVAPIDINDIGTTLDLGGILDGLLQDINTGTVLDDVIEPLNNALLEALVGPGGALRGTVIDALNDALQQVLGQVADALPLGIEIGAVESQCTADEGTASGNGTVAGIDIVVDLGGNMIRVPVNAETTPNSNLLVGAPNQLVNDILDGVSDTLTGSLGGALGGLDALVAGLVQPLTDQLLTALEPTLLQALADALEPIVAGTVNKQEGTDDTIEVTSLDLVLLGSQQLQLGRTACGPNTRGTAHTPEDPEDPTPNNPGDPGDPGDDVPTVVDSGAVGSEDIGRLALGATGALLVMAGAGSLMRRRFSELG